MCVSLSDADDANDLRINRESKCFVESLECRTFAVVFQTIGFMKADKTYKLAMKRITHIATRGLVLTLFFMFVGCGVSQEDSREAAEEDFCITGTWELDELRFLSGQRVDVCTGYEYVWYRFFEDNGTYYVAELADSDIQKPVKPHEMSEYFFMMSPYDTVYIEHGKMRDLDIIDNHTIGIDRGDYVEVYVKNDKLSAKRVLEIERSVESTLRPNQSKTTQYIVPVSSNPDNSYLWIWIAVLVFVVCVVSLYIYIKTKDKHQTVTTEKEDGEIKEAAQCEEQPEQAFFHSDYYLSLRQRLYEGPTLKNDEWERLESQMRIAYPMFFRRLAELGQFSEVELRVCMLTKLRIPPSAIAIHTCREYSSISSIRSRLYFKLFGKKGGAKELDEFILSL